MMGARQEFARGVYGTRIGRAPPERGGMVGDKGEKWTFQPLVKSSPAARDENLSVPVKCAKSTTRARLWVREDRPQRIH